MEGDDGLSRLSFIQFMRPSRLMSAEVKMFLSRGTSSSATNEREFSFRLRRKQFPVVPSFAIIISKDEGQTIQNLSLYLTTPSSSHGQLYVALL